MDLNEKFSKEITTRKALLEKVEQLLLSVYCVLDNDVEYTMHRLAEYEGKSLFKIVHLTDWSNGKGLARAYQELAELVNFDVNEAIEKLSSIEEPRVKEKPDIFKKAREILLRDDLKELERNLELHKLKQEFNCSENFLQNEVIKPLKKDLWRKLLTRDIKQYLEEPDPLKRITMRQSICGRYRVTKKDFSVICEHMEKHGYL